MTSAHPALSGPNFRVTPLTPRLVRLEYSPTGMFENRPTTMAINRQLKLDPEHFTVGEYQGRLTLTTENFRLEYDRGPFSTNGLKLEVLGGVSAYHSVWRFAQDLALPADLARAEAGHTARSLDGNLGGAARTLDVADGAVPLEDGVNSRLGFAVIDDARSMVVTADGSLAARPVEDGAQDLYVFAAGHDHVAAVRDFFSLSGPQPLLPRWALGNWWSRFHPYTAARYLELMDAFRDEGIPLAVAVIDMDWHLTQIDPALGSGWTGYTWNRDLFPDPAAFQEALHDRGLAVTLNVHPADGVRSHEDAYTAMCERMGRAADGTPIPFDVNNPAFMEAYFEVLHRDLEELGTDFWWVDWQSGPYSSTPGVDPLWVLNHEHFAHSARTLDRPLTFSRYAGPGSHRYPVGFSGDSLVTWDSLAFQPRFTAAAANIGYGWWSHDIGGHMEGYRDNELATRWVQFGVFSPIMRLHSSNSEFSGKEPWNFPLPHGEVMAAHLRLRHRLLPYLHAMNYRAHHEGRSLVEPVYFEDQDPRAYEYRDEYFFGSQMLVAPIIRPSHSRLNRASADVYVPKGEWIDLFTGTWYSGHTVQQMFRSLESIPVLVRAGGIVPLTPREDTLAEASTPPSALEIIVTAGDEGKFTLHEEWLADEGSDWSHVSIRVSPHDETLTIDVPAQSPTGSVEALSARQWTFAFHGFDRTAFTDLEIDGADIIATHEPAQGRAQAVHRPTAADTPAPDSRRVSIAGIKPGTPVTLRSRGFSTTTNGTTELSSETLAQVHRLIDDAEIGYSLKEAISAAVRDHGRGAVRQLASMGRAPMGHLPQVNVYEQVDAHLMAALAELLG